MKSDDVVDVLTRPIWCWWDSTSDVCPRVETCNECPQYVSDDDARETFFAIRDYFMRHDDVDLRT